MYQETLHFGQGDPLVPVKMMLSPAGQVIEEIKDILGKIVGFRSRQVSCGLPVENGKLDQFLGRKSSQLGFFRLSEQIIESLPTFPAAFHKRTGHGFHPRLSAHARECFIEDWRVFSGSGSG